MRLRTLAYVAVLIMLVIVVLFVVKVAGGPKVTFSEPVTSDGPHINKDDAAYGDPSATNQIVHFGYAGCDHCEEVQSSVRELIDEGADAVLVWEDFPNTSLAPESLSSAIAMRCAQEQEAFWEYQPFVFTARNPDQAAFVQIAEQLDLRSNKFERCLKNGKGAEIVQRSIEEGNALSITATPTIFINGVRYTGLLTQLEINSLLVQP